jgi:hypothetical protein
MTASVISRFGLLEVLAHGDHAVVRRPARARHAAVAEGRIAHGLDGLPRRARVADVRDLDALHAHVEEAQDEGGVEAGRADDGRDAHALGRHHHELHVAQVEARVLEIDERGVEAGMADDLDDLRLGDAAHVRAQGESALAQDLLDSVRLHGRSPRQRGSRKARARPRAAACRRRRARRR